MKHLSPKASSATTMALKPLVRATSKREYLVGTDGAQKDCGESMKGQPRNI